MTAPKPPHFRRKTHGMGVGPMPPTFQQGLYCLTRKNTIFSKKLHTYTTHTPFFFVFTNR